MKGGVHPAFHKEESTLLPIKRLPIPPKLIIPVQQTIGDRSVLEASVGDKVLKGQVLTRLSASKQAAVIHAPSSGVITDIKDHTLPHPSGMSGLCFFIDTDGLDQWFDDAAIESKQVSIDVLTQSEILKRIESAGIVGLGGAAFPSAVKLAAAGKKGIHTLIINAAECEPYITCDDRLIRENADQILEGIKILLQLLKVERCIIGIEDNKAEAIDSLNIALTDYHFDDHTITVAVVPTQYPSGDARQLTQLLTGVEIPKGQHSVESRILCHNVATAHAVYEAVTYSKPLISRVVTITGDGVLQPQNVEALFGTPISFLIEQLGGYTKQAERMIMGGPMMGFALPSDELPIVKASNCILVTSLSALQLGSNSTLNIDKQVMPCIRCNKCAQVCPVNLLPQQLYWHARAHDFEKATQHKLSDCIECGACSYVCPSAIPLVDYFRFAKTEIKSQQQAALKSTRSRERFEFNELRRQRIKVERDAKRKKHKDDLMKKKAAEAEAAALTGEDDKQVSPVDAEKVAKKDAIKAAMERAKAKKAAMKKESEKDGSNNAV